MEDPYIEFVAGWGQRILGWFLPNLNTIEWTGHIAILLWSAMMVIFSGRLFTMVENTSSTMLKMKAFRSLNFLVIILMLLDLFLLRFHQNYEQLLSKIGLSLFTTYSAIYLYSLASFHTFKRFGAEKTIDNRSVYVETYSTRIINLLLVVCATFGTFYIIIKVWGADSLLETTGLMGILVGFLAFTAPVWAPDIISGLIILNSQMLEDGDVVVIDGFPNEYIISKVSFVYVTLYDVRNNHRALVKNSRFLSGKIDNLSKIASTEGMRAKLSYNIGYPKLEGRSGSERVEAFESFMRKIDNMFNRAFEECASNEKTIQINTNKPFEWALTQTGDYALEFTMWFYFNRIPNTKVTATARKHLMGTAYKVNQAVYKASIFEDIDLATPDLANITFNDSLSVENMRNTPSAGEEQTQPTDLKNAPDNMA